MKNSIRLARIAVGACLAAATWLVGQDLLGATLAQL